MQVSLLLSFNGSEIQDSREIEAQVLRRSARTAVAGTTHAKARLDGRASAPSLVATKDRRAKRDEDGGCWSLVRLWLGELL